MLIKAIKSIVGNRIPWSFYVYILREVFRPFLGAALFFLFVLMMFQIIRLADTFIVHNASGFSVMSLMSYLALTFTPVILPIAFLLAVLLGFGRLSTDSEILAMRAAGLSVYSMLSPVLGFGVVVATITLFCNFYFVPYGARMFRYELFRIFNTKAIATIHEGTFTEGFFDLVLYADKVDSRNNSLSKVLMYDEREKGAPVTVVAKSGRIVNNMQDSTGAPGLLLRLFEGSLHRGDPGKYLYERTQFDVYDIFLRIETARVVGVDSAKTMDIGSLRSRLKQIQVKLDAGASLDSLPREEKLDYLTFGVEYWKRFALSASCIIFALMGVAFGVIRTRTVRSNSFLICLLVLLLYWAIYTVGHNLASEGKVPAFVGMWAANFILVFIAVFTLRKVAR
jgi:lipopolysaccharide export system permease protein